MKILPDLLFDTERAFGPRPALATRRGLRTDVWTYRDLAEAARAAADRLGAAGVQPGDRVIVLSPNCPELVVSMFGAWLAGAVLVPLDLRTAPDVIERIRQRTDPRLAITPTSADGLAGLPARDPFALGSRAPRARDSVSAPERAPDGLAEIIFTSGTTGAPKGVMLTHANILANVDQSLDALPFQTGQRLLSLLPLSHMLEQTCGLLAPLKTGATVFYVTSRRSTAILAAMQRHQIGVLIGVPEVLKLLLAGIEREVDRRGKRAIWEKMLSLAERLPMEARPKLFGSVHRRFGGNLRQVVCGGAALDPDLWHTWELLGVRVSQGYGATECAPVIATNRLHRRLPACVGWPLRDLELRLAPDGEILVRGPNVMPGYWRDPEATAAAFDDGWYRTGDVGAWGSQGELRLMGRKKEMIVLEDGRNVFPLDLEVELARDPAIKDCVVIGKPRRHGGEEVHAVVIPAGDEAEAAAAVRRANGRLGSQQQIGGFTIWREPDFPRTPSLKVKRRDVLAAVERPSGEAAVPTTSAAIGDRPEDRLRGLLARASGRPLAEVRLDSDISLDLGLDSLARVELAVLLEEELGRSLPDEEMAVQRTVADLLAALERGGSLGVTGPLPAWPRRVPARFARALIQDAVLLPLWRRVVRPRRVEGLERLQRLRGPALLIANHSSHLDSVSVLALLPPDRRRRTAVAAAADYFFEQAPTALFSAAVLGAFPFHRQGPISSSLAHCGDLADAGYSILIFPEGTRSPNGRLQPFKQGIGLLARELGLPVIPIHLDGLHAILPKGRTWPRPGPLRARVGEPLQLSRELSNAEATEALETAMRRLAGELVDPPGPDHVAA